MTCNVLSMCGQQDTDVLCANAAALALHLSDIPWHGPVATLRVSLTRDERVRTCVWLHTRLQLLLNTSHADPTMIACNVLMSVTANKQIAMVEVGGRPTPNDVLMKCIDYGAGTHVYGMTVENSYL
jgi:polyribonucleotide nucleotidyltransferase